MKVRNMSDWFLVLRFLGQFENDELHYRTCDMLLGYLEISLNYMNEHKAEEELVWVCDNLRAFANVLYGEGHVLSSSLFWTSIKQELWSEVFLHPPFSLLRDDKDWNEVIILRHF